ncbi:MAG: hypothetical protein J6J42_04230 [Lachnospiraceae bacterium]|nr:hypothetical protein [Lachnospiraceae bacterium]
MKKTAETLLDELKSSGTLECFLLENEGEFEEESLVELLARLLKQYGKRKQEVIREAGLDITYGYQIFDGRKNPKREKLLQLAFGFPLSVEDTNHLLRIGGVNPLSVRNKRDVICMYCLYRGMKLLG